MDQTDSEILDILREDGRRSYTDIAEEVGVSEGTVRNRIERMRESGRIRGFTVETGKQNKRAFVMVKVATGKDISKVLEQFPGGMEVNEVAGEYDLILEFLRDSDEELNEQLDSIRSVEGVEETKTYTVLKTRKI